MNILCILQKTLEDKTPYNSREVMAETFTEAEQEEIINKFLTACGEKQEEPEEEDFKTTYERLNIEVENYCRTIKNIETKTYVPIKYALMKYYNKSDQKDIDHYEWCRNKMIEKYNYILQIHKKGNRYVCSKERLEQIDFNRMERAKNYYRSWHC